jgi:hypothetical protein
MKGELSACSDLRFNGFIEGRSLLGVRSLAFNFILSYSLVSAAATSNSLKPYPSFRSHTLIRKCKTGSGFSQFRYNLSRFLLQPYSEATGGFEPPNEAFAEPCLVTWPRRRWGYWSKSPITCSVTTGERRLGLWFLRGRWDSNPRPSPLFRSQRFVTF